MKNTIKKIFKYFYGYGICMIVLIIATLIFALWWLYKKKRTQANVFYQKHGYAIANYIDDIIQEKERKILVIDDNFLRLISKEKKDKNGYHLRPKNKQFKQDPIYKDYMKRIKASIIVIKGKGLVITWKEDL